MPHNLLKSLGLAREAYLEDYSDDFIAEVAQKAHNANYDFCTSIGDPCVSWDEASDGIKQSAIDGVHAILKNPELTPEESHENWIAYKQKQGFVYGEVKDEEAKTHPSLVPYAELDENERKKDDIFTDTVKAALSQSQQVAAEGDAADTLEAGTSFPLEVGEQVPATLLDEATQDDTSDVLTVQNNAAIIADFEEAGELLLAVENLLTASAIVEKAEQSDLNATNLQLLQVLTNPEQKDSLFPSTEVFQGKDHALGRQYAAENIREKLQETKDYLLALIKRLYAKIKEWMKALNEYFSTTEADLAQTEKELKAAGPFLLGYVERTHSIRRIKGIVSLDRKSQGVAALDRAHIHVASFMAEYAAFVKFIIETQKQMQNSYRDPLAGGYDSIGNSHKQLLSNVYSTTNASDERDVTYVFNRAGLGGSVGNFRVDHDGSGWRFHFSTEQTEHVEEYEPLISQQVLKLLDKTQETLHFKKRQFPLIDKAWESMDVILTILQREPAGSLTFHELAEATMVNHLKKLNGMMKATASMMMYAENTLRNFQHSAKNLAKIAMKAR